MQWICGSTVVWIWKVCHLRLNIFCVLCKHLSKCETWARHWGEAAPCFQFSLRKLRPGIGPSSGLLVPALCSVSTRSRISGAGEAPSLGPQSTGPPPRHLRVRYNLDTWLISRLQQEKELVIDSSCYNNTAKELNLGESLKLFKNCHAFHRLLISETLKEIKWKVKRYNKRDNLYEG